MGLVQCDVGPLTSTVVVRAIHRHMYIYIYVCIYIYVKYIHVYENICKCKPVFRRAIRSIPRSIPGGMKVQHKTAGLDHSCSIPRSIAVPYSFHIAGNAYRTLMHQHRRLLKQLCSRPEEVT